MAESAYSAGEEALALCLDQLLTGEIGWEACRQQFPEQQKELAELLAVARLLQQATEIAPRPAFRRQAPAQLASRLTGVAAPVALGRAAPSLGERLAGFWRGLRVPRWDYAVVGLLLILLLAVAGVGGVAAVDAAAPGDRLYRTDLALEQARLRLARDQAAEARLALGFAGERLQEAQRLAEAGDNPHLQTALVAYAYQIETIARLNGAGSATSPANLDQRLAHHSQQLDAIFQRGEGADPCERGDGSEARHPLTASLAAQYGQPYEVVAQQLCGGVPFGQLLLALATGQATELPAKTILERRAQGKGWGQLWHELDVKVSPRAGQPATPPRNDERPGDVEESTGGGPLERPGRPEQPGKSDPPGRPEQPGKSDPPGRPEQPGKSDPPGRPEQPGKPAETDPAKESDGAAPAQNDGQQPAQSQRDDGGPPPDVGKPENPAPSDKANSPPGQDKEKGTDKGKEKDK